jgi:TIR domain
MAEQDKSAESSTAICRVFISYSHDSPEHARRVRALGDKLRADGIESWIDQYVQDPDEGWPKWMRSQVKEAHKVLLVFSRTYQQRFEGDEEEGKGLGATFEGAIVTQSLYQSGGRNRKFRPVVLREEDTQFISVELRRFNRYSVDTPEHYENLLRWIHNAPRIVPPPVGKKPDLPPEPIPEQFSSKPSDRAVDKTARPSVDARIVHPLLSARDWQDRPEFKKICEWWQQGGTGLCALIGIGGAGKTATVNRFLQVLPGFTLLSSDVEKRNDLPVPERLFVFSFENAVNPDEFFAELAVWLGESSEKGNPETRATYQQVLRLLEKSAKTCLLVLDGLEKMQEDSGGPGIFGKLINPDLSDLLTRRIAGGYRGVTAIITTRFPILDLEEASYSGKIAFRPISVGGIPQTAAIQLLRQRGVRGADAALERISQACGHHALTVDLTGSYLVEFKEGRPDTPLLVSAADQQAINNEPDTRRRSVLKQALTFAGIAQYYRKALQQNDLAALALLERMCLFRRGVSAATLASIFTGVGKENISGTALAALDEEQVEKKLSYLVRIHLLNEHTSSETNRQLSTVFTIHSVARDGFVLDGEIARQGHEATRQEMIASLGGLPGLKNYPCTLAHLDLLEEIIYHTLEAGQSDPAWHIFAYSMGGYQNLGWRLGDHERGQRITGLFLEREHRLPLSAANRPYCHYFAGLHAAGCADHKKAVWHLTQAVELFSNLSQFKGVSRCHRMIAEIALETGAVVEAEMRIQYALKVVSDSPSSRAEKKARRDSLVCQAKIKTLSGKMDEAKSVLSEVLHIDSTIDLAVESLSVSDLKAITFGGLLLQVSNSDAALSSIERLIDDCQNEMGRENQVLPELRLFQSELYRTRSDFVKAKEGVMWSREWAINRNRKDILCGTYLAEAKILLAESGSTRIQPSSEAPRLRKIEDARKSVEEGLYLARDCGFGIRHIDLLLERARLNLIRAKLPLAFDDINVALDSGHKPPENSGLPTMIAATDPQCGYTSGIVEGRYLRAQAFLLQAEQTLGRADFAPTRFKMLPGEVQSLVESARRELEECCKLLKYPRDLRLAEIKQTLSALNEGVLTRD